MPKSVERLTQPVNLEDHERRVLLSQVKWHYPPEEEDPVGAQIQIVSEGLKEASPFVRRVTHIQRTSHAYLAEIEVELGDGERWELRVFSNQADLDSFKEYLKNIWNLSSEEKVTQRLLIRQLFFIVVTPETRKSQVLRDFRAFTNLRNT